MEEPQYSCISCGSPTKYKNGKCKPCFFRDNPQYNIPSEGEEFIADFMKYYGIKFKSQKELFNLKNDTKSYRIPDFYLTDYKIYLEYNGRYRDKHKHYTEKSEVYKQNQIPCIHIYPDNLGVLDFILDKRLQAELEDKQLFNELNKYRRFKFFKGESNTLTFLVGSFLLIWLATVSEKNLFIGINYFFMAVILFQSYKLYTAFLNIFKRNKYPLSKLKY